MYIHSLKKLKIKKEKEKKEFIVEILQVEDLDLQKAAI